MNQVEPVDRDNFFFKSSSRVAQRIVQGDWLRGDKNNQNQNRILKLILDSLTIQHMAYIGSAFPNLENLTIEFRCKYLVNKLAALLHEMTLTKVRKLTLLVPRIGKNANLLPAFCKQVLPCFPPR